jgi:hypothetical protein
LIVAVVRGINSNREAGMDGKTAARVEDETLLSDDLIDDALDRVGPLFYTQSASPNTAVYTIGKPPSAE